MATVNVLGEILVWSTERPLWQRDALRRLVAQGELKDPDIIELADLCKASHGLVEKTVKAEPLDAKHLPQSNATSKPVSLVSLTHRSGVNALALEQSIDFGPQLTVVFGLNAAGKSGYTRILKRACRARGAEEILGNVVSGSAPGRPSASIKFLADDKPQDFTWDDDQPANKFLSRVSVFDRHCASVYIAEETDVAFRPLGLDLFDKLSDACESVRRVLERERRELELVGVQLPEVPPGTAVHEALSRLTSLTNPDVLKRLAELSDAESASIGELRSRLRDLQSDDPQKRARILELRANRVEALVRRVSDVADALSPAAAKSGSDARDRMTKAVTAAEAAHVAAFGGQPLPHTGSRAWRALWDAAGRYSTTDAYPDDPFPFTGPHSRCVLCQQKLRDDGAERLRRFSEFLTSTLQRERDEASADHQRMTERLASLVVRDTPTTEALDEIQVEDPELAESTRAFLEAAEHRRVALMNSLSGTGTATGETHEVALTQPKLSDHLTALRSRAAELRGADRSDTVRLLGGQLRELEARQILSRHVAAALAEIERKKRLAAYQLCIDETRTTAVTRKSSEVTKVAVTEQITKSFKQELDAIKFRDVEVEMVAAGGSRGALYHKLQLRRAPGVSVPQVVSEGEARCLSIASFFAELSTTADRSAILFDDPVSSLDHSWRDNVAARLAAESNARQVIVFTHDIVFLRSLADHAKGVNADIKQHTLRRGKTAAGLSTPGAPFGAMNVKERIGHLRNAWQSIDKLHRENKAEEYERAATRVYALLRQAWERGVEELLINGVVERYRQSVETQKARKLHDISEQDCEAVEVGMSKCSKWEGGHDHAAADGEPCPGPDEVKADIDAFDAWVGQLRKRR